MFATKIRLLRESKNWSQEFVAEKLNITQTAFSKLESGQTKLTLDRVNELAELFEVSNDYFLTNDLPVVNYNSNGPNGKAIINPNQYYDTPKELYEDLVKAKDVTLNLLMDEVAALRGEIAALRNEKEQLMALINKLSN